MLRDILFACLVAVVIIFVIQNTEVVEFKFLLWTVTMSRALVLFGTLAIGLVAGWLLSFPKNKKQN